jgi:hypothetical protein
MSSATGSKLPPWVDGLSSPRALRAMIGRAPDAFRLRVGRTPRPSAPPYGPLPDARYEDAQLDRGSPLIRIDDAEGRTALRVACTVETFAWGEGTAAFERSLARVWIDVAWPGHARDPVEPEGSGEVRLLAAELLDADAEAARTGAERIATALRGYLGLEDAGAPAADAAADETDEVPPPPEGARRHALRFEGEHLVLRDLERAGPREGAGLYVGLALALGAAAAFTVKQLVDALEGEPTTGRLLGLGALSAILVLASYAMASVARFSYAYAASSTPIAWFSDDRVVIAPWVSRDGAIDTQPEGRYGAAVKVAEIERVLVEPRGDGYAVKLETAHGPMDVLTTTRALADHWASELERALVTVAAPQKKATALMRAKARTRPAVETTG